MEQARQQAVGCKLVQFKQFAPTVTLRMLMEELEVVTLGIESDRCTVDEFELLANQVRRKAITPLKGFVEEIRRIKDEDEIALIAKAEAIGDEAFAHVLNLIQPGMTELGNCHGAGVSDAAQRCIPALALIPLWRQESGLLCLTE